MAEVYEPSLEEMLADGTIRQLMASDGVSEAALRALLGALRRSREGGLPAAAACAAIAR